MGINTDFAQILDQVAPRLRAITNWTEPFGPDKWTRIELLGHLLDSAANNHQRFVRALSQGGARMAGVRPKCPRRSTSFCAGRSS